MIEENQFFFFKWEIMMIIDCVSSVIVLHESFNASVFCKPPPRSYIVYLDTYVYNRLTTYIITFSYFIYRPKSFFFLFPFFCIENFQISFDHCRSLAHSEKFETQFETSEYRYSAFLNKFFCYSNWIFI